MSGFGDCLSWEEALIVRQALCDFASQRRADARHWEGAQEPALAAARERALDESATADRLWERVVDDMRETKIAGLLVAQTGG